MHHFKIGFTFSGKYRKYYIEPVCNELLKMGYRKEDIFFDEWHEALINGINGDVQLCNIYKNCCDSVVVLLSPDYKEKNWTGNVEWRAIKELINTGKHGQICILSVDSVNISDIDGLYQYQTITKPIDNLPPRKIAEFIDQKYKFIAEEFNTYTGSAQKTTSQYVRPELTRFRYIGKDIRPECMDYIIDLSEKLLKYIEYYGKEQMHYDGDDEWCVTKFSKDGLLVTFRDDTIRGKKRYNLHVFDDYNAAYPDESNDVFGLIIYNETIKLEWYIPGNWDEKILSWP